MSYEPEQRRYTERELTLGTDHDQDRDDTRMSPQNLATLRETNEIIDQAAAEMHGICDEANRALQIAWWYTEDAIRRETGVCSMVDLHMPKRKCQCCSHFESMKLRVALLRGRL